MTTSQSTPMNRDEFFRLLASFTPEELLGVQSAYYIAKEGHRDQKRDDGTRYFEHARDVALIIIKHKRFLSKDSVIKALLHDTVEDTRVPPHLIVTVFGPAIWRSLATLSKYVPLLDPVSGAFITRYRKPNEVYFEELRRASVEDRAIKIANRLSNMRTMGVWESSRQVRYALEAQDFLLPLAEATDPTLAKELNAEIEKVLR